MDNIQWYIFDLNGTLYDFWGNNFWSWRLWTKVRERYYELIQESGLWNPDIFYAEMIVAEQEEKIGMSQRFANTIGRTKKEILSSVWWSLDASTIIQNSHYSKKIIPTLSGRGSKIFLVTAAPNIWATKALKFMSLHQYFKEVCSLEDFGGSKKEIFARIQQESWIQMSQFISIGDQLHSDIIPAQELWMQSLHVASQKDLLNLI